MVSITDLYLHTHWPCGHSNEVYDLHGYTTAANGYTIRLPLSTVTASGGHREAQHWRRGKTADFRLIYIYLTLKITLLTHPPTHPSGSQSQHGEAVQASDVDISWEPSVSTLKSRRPRTKPSRGGETQSWRRPSYPQAHKEKDIDKILQVWIMNIACHTNSQQTVTTPRLSSWHFTGLPKTPPLVVSPPYPLYPLPYLPPPPQKKQKKNTTKHTSFRLPASNITNSPPKPDKSQSCKFMHSTFLVHVLFPDHVCISKLVHIWYHCC